jgi:hypothetical protein
MHTTVLRKKDSREPLENRKSARTILNALFMIVAPEQSYQLDYAACGYKEGVTGFSAKLLLSVRSWREKLRRCFIRISSLFVARAMESEVRPTLVT